MPEVEIEIGGRRFEVACQPGEEGYLLSAASALNEEASNIGQQSVRLSETRMLLMAGLMLADQMGNFKDKLAKRDVELTDAHSEISKLQAQLSASLLSGTENEELVSGFKKTLTDITDTAERLASKISAS